LRKQPWLRSALLTLFAQNTLQAFSYSFYSKKS
jgi:hypothetical protein